MGGKRIFGVGVIVLIVGFLSLVFLGGRYVTSVLAQQEEKVNLCHKTSSEENPWVVQEVSANEEQSHLDNGDFLYQGEFGIHTQEARDWCSEHQSQSQPTCLGDIPSSLLVDVTQGVTNDVDSGLHGNWAIDNYGRHIKVWRLQVEGNTYCADVRYDGTFDVQPGVLSPQNGNPLTGNEDGIMTGGRRAQIVGHFLGDGSAWSLTGFVGSYDYGCAIDGTCTGRFNWVNKYFNDFKYEDLNWGWTYTSCGHGQWINASTGNSGDIVVGPTDEVCEQTPTPTPEATPTPTGGSNTGGSSGAPQCTAQKPSQPSSLSAVKTSPTTVKLTWGAVVPVTYYSISYGTDPNNFQFGVPNVGNTTSFVIGALNPDLKYYFKVIAVNDCMPSDPSAEVTPGGVLGASTESKVLGASTDRLAGTHSDFYIQRLALSIMVFGVSLVFGVKLLHGQKES